MTALGVGVSIQGSEFIALTYWCAEGMYLGVCQRDWNGVVAPEIYIPIAAQLEMLPELMTRRSHTKFSRIRQVIPACATRPTSLVDMV